VLVICISSCEQIPEKTTEKEGFILAPFQRSIVVKRVWQGTAAHTMVGFKQRKRNACTPLSPFISFVPPGYEMPLTFRAGLLFNL
jgi:hypothetical protein